jgi:small-conductance mechanosensitive channel
VVVEAPPPAPSVMVPAPVSSAAIERSDPATVRLGDSPVFSLYAPHGAKPPDERARLASKALAGVVEKSKGEDVKVSRQGEAVVVLVGQTPIVQLTELDAQLSGDSTLDVHAASVAAALRRAIDTERRRSEIARSVFSISLVVFFALIAFYLMRKLGEFADRARQWLDEHGEKSLRLRVRDIEVLSPATAQSAALIAVSLGRLLGQFGIFYTWLVVVLSMFEATRGYTERLTGFVVQPLSHMMGRVATSLPLLVVAVIAGLAVFVLVRFVGLFFRSIDRRETSVPWMPAELAAPTSVIVRVSIVLVALVLGGPIVTGDDGGAVSRVGAVALAALGLASVPLAANALIGVYVVFARKLRVGHHVEIGGNFGRVAGLDLMEVRLEDAEHGELRFPHLLLLHKPTRVFGLRPRVALDVIVAAASNLSSVRALLERVSLGLGRDAHVALVSADAEGVVYRLTLSPDSFAARSDLQLAVLEALRTEGIELGRAQRTRGAD